MSNRWKFLDGNFSAKIQRWAEHRIIILGSTGQTCSHTSQCGIYYTFLLILIAINMKTASQYTISVHHTLCLVEIKDRGREKQLKNPSKNQKSQRKYFKSVPK